MIISPVIIRELRAEARRPMNYSLRVLGAALALIILAVMVPTQTARANEIGGSLFTTIHTTLFCLIWVMVPLLTADCLARERREGTLPLLFLTPLTAHGIVLGKSLAQMLRALVLLVAIWPVLAIPVLLGGVSGADVLYASAFELSALLAGLSAGLLASACCRHGLRAMLLAEVFAAITVFIFGLGFLVCTLAGEKMLGIHLPWDDVPWRVFIIGLFDLCTGSNGLWHYIAKDPTFGPIWNLATPLFVLFNGFLLWLVILAAGWKIKKVRQENPLNSRQVQLTKLFTTPILFRSFLERNLTKRLNRNPIAWLQRYSWSSRLTEWGWFAFSAAVLTQLIAVNYSDAHAGFTWLGLALLCGMAFSSVGSFQKEKQNGALELLLVTPLTERQIIWGRMFGIWQQFAPAMILMVLVRIYLWDFLGYYNRSKEDDVFWMAMFAGSCFLVPLFGLYFAVRSKNFFAAWFWTCLLGLAIPLAWTYSIVRALFYYLPEFGLEGDPMLSTAIELIVYLPLWSVLSIAGRKMLFRLLKSRSFTAKAP